VSRDRVTLHRSYQHYDCLVGIGGGIGFTPFMSILKDFMAEKRRVATETEKSRGSESRGHTALFYGVCRCVCLSACLCFCIWAWLYFSALALVGMCYLYGFCRSFEDVAWWSSLTSEPDFSEFVSSCSMAIAGAPQQQLLAADPLKGSPLQQTNSSAKFRQDLSEGRLAVTLFCTGANKDHVSTAKAMAPPGVSVRPGRPHFDKIFKCVRACVGCGGYWHVLLTRA